MIRRSARAWLPHLLCTPALLLLLPGCSEGDRVAIEHSRPRHSSAREPRLNVGYEEAFPEAQEYRWTLPEGWTEQPPQQFRLVNFSFGPEGRGECYLSRVQGGMVENIQRWYQQMDLPAPSEQDVAQLPTRQLFGQPGRLVDLRGTYSGAMGAPPKPGYRLVGVVISTGRSTVTVKMTGPEEVVTANMDQFNAFCDSLRLAPGHPRGRASSEM